MSKRLLIAFLWCLITTPFGKLWAQTESFSKNLPSIGDTFYYGLPSQEVDIYYLNKKNDTWQFDALTPNFAVQCLFLNPNQGTYSKHFKNANLMLKKSNSEESYYIKKKEGIYCIGKTRPTTYTKSGILIEHFEPAAMVLRGELAGSAMSINTYKSVITLAANEIMYKSSVFPPSADSFRMEVNYIEKMSVHDHGNLEYDNREYKATKVVRDGMVSYQSMIKNNKDRLWSDYTKPMSSYPIEIKEMLLYKNYTYADFFVPEYVWPIISYTTHDNVVGEVIVQTREKDNRKKFLAYNGTDFTAYPNPSFGQINILIQNGPIDDYRLQVSNIVGQKILTKDSPRNSSNIHSFNLSSLKRGTYIYSIFDSKGRKLGTKRFSIISI